MALTFIDIYNEVAGQAWSMYDGDAESIDEMESALKSSINKALSEIWCSYPFPFRIKTLTIKTTSGNSEYSTPNGNIIKKTVSGSQVYSVRIGTNYLEYLDDYETLEEKEGTPAGFYIKNDTLCLYPVPDDTYTVIIEYLTLAIGEDDFGDSVYSLQNDNDTIDIPEKYENIFKKFFAVFFTVLFIFLLVTFSASSVDFLSSEHPYVQVVCGDYKHNFSTVDYGYSMSRTLVNALKIAGKRANDNQKAFVYVSAGEYELDHTLLIYSNTTLVAEGAKFSCYHNMVRNAFDNAELSAVSYTGSQNITIIGGEWEMEVPFEYASIDDLTLTHSTFRFGHCKNLVIKNCIFKNNYNSHDIELGGVCNAEITNCSFVNDKSVNGIKNSGGRESVQIDVNSEKAVPFIPEYDYTACQNITVSDCYFKNKFRGVGSHHGVIGNPYENIKICNNIFTNIAGVAVFGIYWNNVSIYNNTMNNVGSGIDVYSISNLSSKNMMNYLNYSYEVSLNTIKNSISEIYGNYISVRKNDNLLNKKFGIRVSGSNYNQKDTETGVNKGIYYIYNVNLSDNIISGETDSNIIKNYNNIN